MLKESPRIFLSDVPCLLLINTFDSVYGWSCVEAKCMIRSKKDIKQTWRGPLPTKNSTSCLKHLPLPPLAAIASEGRNIVRMIDLLSSFTSAASLPNRMLDLLSAKDTAQQLRLVLQIPEGAALPIWSFSGRSPAAVSVITPRLRARLRSPRLLRDALSALKTSSAVPEELSTEDPVV